MNFLNYASDSDNERDSVAGVSPSGHGNSLTASNGEGNSNNNDEEAMAPSDNKDEAPPSAPNSDAKPTICKSTYKYLSELPSPRGKQADPAVNETIQQYLTMKKDTGFDLPDVKIIPFYFIFHLRCCFLLLKTSYIL